MKTFRSCLLVENDPEDQQYFLETLHLLSEDTGCYAVSTVEEALSVLNEETIVPDYIFTEVNLPGKNGFELVQALKSSGKFKSVPVVIFTSDYSEIQIEKAKKAGASLIFSKTRLQALPDFLKKILQHQTVL